MAFVTALRAHQLQWCCINMRIYIFKARRTWKKQWCFRCSGDPGYSLWTGEPEFQGFRSLFPVRIRPEKWHSCLLWSWFFLGINPGCTGNYMDFLISVGISRISGRHEINPNQPWASGHHGRESQSKKHQAVSYPLWHLKTREQVRAGRWMGLGDKCTSVSESHFQCCVVVKTDQNREKFNWSS